MGACTCRQGTSRVSPSKYVLRALVRVAGRLVGAKIGLARRRSVGGSGERADL